MSYETIKLVKVTIEEVSPRGPVFNRAVPQHLVAETIGMIEMDTVKEATYTKEQYPLETLGFSDGAGHKHKERFYIMKEDKDRLVDLLNQFLELQKEAEHEKFSKKMGAWLASFKHLFWRFYWRVE